MTMVWFSVGAGASTVDDAHVRQGDGGRADGEEGLQSRRKAVLGKGSRNDDKDGGEFHRYIVPFEARLKIFLSLETCEALQLSYGKRMGRVNRSKIRSICPNAAGDAPEKESRLQNHRPRR